ncbi:type I-E CRISPR-associated protein Cas5/CasD [Shimia sp. R9_3]|uniref:type I-E CRISPR-associated protein Cas5/CasD n=1 Tax=Shimia sp. R9_3 TaxID=2821113 RepID=UPI001ADBA0D1|nr:type I-E CRISPR-associated protein Cas5/CasD [Shimia sp. R9_3]MBO9401317.1 type I-E CRISPR-associated protein Cas5/CasD [Shimia sp. R9_3]
MIDYIVFSLVAPMGSFGGLAGHERRGSDAAPGRSALLGLLGAALGIRRDDDAGQRALDRWQTAVGVLNDGPPLQDFHTVQTVPSANIKAPATRADALRALKPSDNAVITRRDYRMDCVFVVAIWDGEDADRMIAAMRQPLFTPYLGRKSCPLAAPMAPIMVVAENVVEALSAAQLPDWLPPMSLRRVISDQPTAGAIAETLWDQPLDREAWHFGPRTAYVSQVNHSHSEGESNA